MHRYAAVALALFLAGCPGSGDGADPGGATAGSVESGSEFFQGFGFRWKIRPHRINRIGVAPLAFQGGSWADGQEASDTATWTHDTAAVSSPYVLAWTGETGALALEGSFPDDAAVVEETVTHSISALGLSAATKFAVLLRGFDLDTDVTHEDGYTTRGLSAQVKNVSVSGDALKFTARLRLEAAPVPDRVQKLGSYGSTGRLRYTVVGLTEGDVTHGSRSSTLEYPAGVAPEQESATASQQSVTLQGGAGHALGFAALTGFDIVLNPDVSLWPGRYLREIRVRLHDFEYDAAAGKMKLKCDGYYSNSGPVTWALVHRFKATFALVQAPSGTVSTSTSTGTLP